MEMDNCWWQGHRPVRMDFRRIVPERNSSADRGWGKLPEGDWGDVNGEALCEWSLEGKL